MYPGARLVLHEGCRRMDVTAIRFPQSTVHPEGVAARTRSVRRQNGEDADEPFIRVLSVFRIPRPDYTQVMLNVSWVRWPAYTGTCTASLPCSVQLDATPEMRTVYTLAGRSSRTKGVPVA